MTSEIINCALCSLPVSSSSIRDQAYSFCCVGCHTVFKILTTQQLASDFRSHPLFRQAVDSGLISNPHLFEEIKKNTIEISQGERKRLVIEIEEMWCPSCSELIRLVLMQKKGVCYCAVDYTTDLAVIEYSQRHLSQEDIYKAIHSLGYRVSDFESVENKQVNSGLYARFIVAAFCALNLMMFSYPIYASTLTMDLEGYIPLLSWLSLGAVIPILTYSSFPIIRRFWNSLLMGVCGMETLVVMGVGAALIVSLYEMIEGTYRIYFDSMAVIITFVLLGKIIENKAKFSAKKSLLQLSRSLPKRGRKKFDAENSSFVSIKEIEIGDQLIVLTGEKIILDGVIVEGTGTCNESLITGESLPIIKKVGDKVLGGSILQNGYLVVRVTTDQRNSTLGKIIDLVEQRIEHKTVYIRAVDRIVQWFIPTVIVLAFSTALFCFVFQITESVSEAIFRGITILLIACPCAIGIAAPMAESYMIHALASLGVFVRNRGCLSLLGKETVFVFDKTGTITQGKFQLISGAEQLSSHQQQAIRSLTQCSTHPLSQTISSALNGKILPITQVEEYVGRGLRGVIKEKSYQVGSATFFKERGISIPDPDHLEEIITQVHIAEDDKYVTTLRLGDTLRPETKDLLKNLKPAKTHLVSGDSKDVVEKVAYVSGFDSYQFGYNPLQKRDFIDNLKASGETVTFVGDGINDTAALAGAHIGISVMTAADMSIQVSDILLTTDRLDVIPKARRIAKRGQYILKQNLFWAFFYNVVGIGLAMTGHLTPIFATFAMTMSSLFVLYNSRRVKIGDGS